VTDLVDDKITEISARNDNDETANVSSGELNWSNKEGDTLTLENGTYYLTKIDMQTDDNQRLVLDTSGGDIELAVDGKFHMSNTKIVVSGDGGAVRVYGAVSDTASGKDLDLTGAQVEVQDGSGSRTFEAPRFWLYAPAGIEADLKQGDDTTEFTGVIYAPDSDSTNGAVQLGDAEVNGAVVAHVESSDTKAWIHFDEALVTEGQTGLGDPNDPRVTHMHITTNEVEVELDD